AIGIELDSDASLVGVENDHLNVLVVRYNRCALDQHAIGRNIFGKRTAAARRRGRDLVDDVHAADDLAEDGITESLRCRLTIVEGPVIAHVDEELRSCGMRVAGAGHGNRAWNVE